MPTGRVPSGNASREERLLSEESTRAARLAAWTPVQRPAVGSGSRAEQPACLLASDPGDVTGLADYEAGTLGQDGLEPVDYRIDPCFQGIDGDDAEADCQVGSVADGGGNFVGVDVGKVDGCETLGNIAVADGIDVEP